MVEGAATATIAAAMASPSVSAGAEPLRTVRAAPRDPHIAEVVEVSQPGAALVVHEVRLTDEGRAALGDEREVT